MNRGSVLVVDDDALFRAALVRYLEGESFAVVAEGDPAAALERLEQRTFDLVLTDLRMPGLDGIAFVRRVRALDPEAVCIVVTGFGNPERSVEALSAGAFWFIEKSYERIACLSPLVEKALEFRRLHGANRQLQRQLESRYGFDNIVGESEALRATIDMVRKVADSEATALVLGESGVGKELFARAIHYNSPRAARPFVAVNCGAIPEELLESELFGHVRGAFSGALRDRVGRFAAANGGTIFLDEIGDMSPKLQTKLLRVLQEREYEPVGSSRTERADVRVVAATNQNLPELIREKRFREDLYFRLCGVPIEVPSLRARREDVPLLVRHYIEVQRRSYPDIAGITDTALKRMTEYDWPGNVRELQGLVERLVVLRRSGWVDESDLPPSVAGQRLERPSVSIPREGIDCAALVAAYEEELILAALNATGWNKNRAAQLLGMKRTTLVEKLRVRNLTPPGGAPDLRTRNS
ncbi:MAG TPA: sigma-54 dependent transcriptional regulator [Myxococcota bacterium]|nr:sigma-54 dependent transcriptional regulator [Myxococcota bacterium]